MVKLLLGCIAVICNGKVKYSEWFQGSTARIKATPDTKALCNEKLKFTHVEDFSISKGYSKMELMMQALGGLFSKQ